MEKYLPLLHLFFQLMAPPYDYFRYTDKHLVTIYQRTS